ncbi:interferon gamma receptor 1 [Eublepharis macularius]|uniref:Interferon gamma receptor 1 n=1 Tax=Eublepharis macularius TaxID=481883 RepID=A0AA97IVJ8_EUBMA|nr:interferon gamma receptor 1 [Eublepharis macularius]
MGLARPLVLLALLPLAFGGWPGAEQRQAEVPPPTNVTIQTYNFKTSLHWDYQNMSPKPLFTVKILCYGNSYTEVSSCANISQHYCDLTHKINKECISLWAKVKALAGSRESEYKESESFDPIRDARIGPAKFNLSVEDGEIAVDIEHPLTPYHNVKENLTDFSYKVFLWEKENPQERDEFEADICNMDMCSVSLHVHLGFTYCVSVQGISADNSVTGEESKADCITVPSKRPLDKTGLIIGGVVSCVVVGVVLAIFLACKWAEKRNIPLPKSLVSIVRSIKPVNTFETKAEGKYSAISPFTYNSDEKPMETIDHITEVETIDPNDSGKIAVDSQTIQQAAAEESCESEQSPEASDAYFKSVSGQEEMCNSLLNEDDPRVDVQQPTDLGACRKVSGYDKPHWKCSDTVGDESAVA